MVRHFIYLLVILSFLLGCRKKEANTPEGDFPPVFTLTSLNGSPVKTDTLKLSLKSARKEAVYQLTIGGDFKDKMLNSRSINGSGNLTIGTMPEGNVTVKNGTYVVSWKATAPGTTLIKLELRDSKQNIREASVEVTAIDNYPPIAGLKILKLGKEDPLEYLIDASSSFDKDAAFGGGIASYEYTIGTKKFKTDKPSIKWIFETAGIYNLSIRVSDSDGASAVLTNKLTVI